jgi:hypothetical protein
MMADADSTPDWISVQSGVGPFTAACGSLNLGEVLHLFRLLVDGLPRLPE